VISINDNSHNESILEEHQLRKKLSDFETELGDIINSNSVDNILDIPDYIIREMIISQILIIYKSVKQRDMWIGLSKQKNGLYTLGVST
jgi:hypothetical protein